MSGQVTIGAQLHEILTEMVWVEFHTAKNGEVYAYAPRRKGWIGRGPDVASAILDLHDMAEILERRAAGMAS